MLLTPQNEAEFYLYSITKSRDFWRSSCEALGIVFKNDFKLTNENIVDATNPKHPKWFTGAALNIADSFLKKAKTNPDKIAIIYEDESTKKKNITYRELDELSNKFANALQDSGIKKGDHIGLCTAGMNVESIAAYLGAMKFGATIVCLLPTSQKSELQLRIDQLPAKPKLMVTQDYGNKNNNRLHPLYENIRELGIPSIVINDNSLKPVTIRENDKTFNEFINAASEKFESASLSPEHHVAVLFSSGTTGTPKAIPWFADCYIKSANDGRLHHLMNDNDILCWPSNFGWMMGSFDIASAFINDATLAVFEGNPVSRNFAAFIEKNEITKFGIIPAFAEAWERTGLFRKRDITTVKIFMSTSAASNPENYRYIQKLLNNAHPCEYSGGTEIAGALNTCLPYSPVGASEFNTPAFGTKLHFIPHAENNNLADLFIVVSNKGGYTPPMGLSRILLNKDHEKEYFTGETNSNGEALRKHGDTVNFTGKIFSGDIEDINDLRFTSSGRADDIININGNKVGADILEGWIRTGIKGKSSESMIADLAVFQTEPAFGNKVIFYVMINKTPGTENPKDIITREFKDAIKVNNALFAAIDDIVFVDKISKMGSKVQRKEMRKNYNPRS